MFINWDEFCKRYVDAIGTNVVVIVGGIEYPHHIETIDDAIDVISFYDDEDVDGVYISVE